MNNSKFTFKHRVGGNASIMGCSSRSIESKIFMVEHERNLDQQKETVMDGGGPGVRPRSHAITIPQNGGRV